MSDILLATKTYIPPLHSNLVSRPRLIQRLNDGISHHHRLTLVSAPAGYGKSTLVSEWISQAGMPAAWLSLEKGDDAPARFWRYFIHALHTIPDLRQAGIGGSLLQLHQSPQPPSMEMLLADLVNDLSQLKERVVLVLDDLHAISENQIHQALIFLIDHLPRAVNGLHLVVASRMDPPWPLARWRVRNELTEVRSKDLRFSPEEAKAFLNDVMELTLATREIDLLDQRTEGWIAGLQMAALSLQGRGDIEGFLERFTGSNRFVLDYLIEEVLSQQKPEILDFLLQTSILEHLTAPLCDAVTDGKDSQATLVQLEKSNLFLVSMDEERQWYRYHHLFADLLYIRLKQTYPETIPALHGKACTWYTENGLLSRALMHAIATGDLECLVRLVEKYAFTILDVNEASTFLSWLNTLSDSVMGSHPWLHIARAWLLSYLGQMEEIEPLLHEAERLADRSNRRLMGYIAAMWTLSGELGLNRINGVQYASKAFELLPQEEYRPRAFVAYHLSNILAWKGDILPALKALEDSFTWSLAAGDTELAMVAQFEKANILRNLGRLTESMHIFEKTFQMVDTNYPEKKNRSLPVGYAYLQLSGLYLEWNNTSEALRCANEGIQICRMWGYSDYLYNGLMAFANILLAKSDLDGALGAIHEAKQMFTNISPTSRVNAMEAIIHLARGDLESASAWAAQSSLSPNDTPDFEYRFVYRHYATILMAQGRLQEAYGILERMRSILENAGALSLLLETFAQQIIILHSWKEDEKALSLLQHALELAKPEGFIRVFISKGKPMRLLLQAALSRGIQTEYINRLLLAFDSPEAQQKPTASTVPIPQSKNKAARLIEPLSEREIQVLRLLDSALTGEEISQELYLSVNTVRTHIRNIYSKLDVHGRIEAIQKAKEAGLI